MDSHHRIASRSHETPDKRHEHQFEKVVQCIVGSGKKYGKPRLNGRLFLGMSFDHVSLITQIDWPYSSPCRSFSMASPSMGKKLGIDPVNRHRTGKRHGCRSNVVWISGFQRWEF